MLANLEKILQSPLKDLALVSMTQLIGLAQEIMLSITSLVVILIKVYLLVRLLSLLESQALENHSFVQET